MKYFLLLCLCIVVFADLNAQSAFVRSYGGSDVEWANGIARSGDGGYVMVGATFSGDGDFTGMRRGECDAWVIKCRADGSVQWKRIIGGTKYDNMLAVVSTSDAGYLVCGNSYSNDGDVAGMNNGSSDIMITKLDASGTIQWIKLYGGSAEDDACAIAPTPDGGYVLTGGTWSNNGIFVNTPLRNNPDIFVMKINSLGVVQWVRTQGGSGYDRGEGIMVGDNGQIVVTGTEASSDGAFAGINRGEDDVFILCYDGDGNPLRKKTCGGSRADFGRALVSDTQGGVLLTGWTFSGDQDFIGSDRGLEPDAFVLRLDSLGAVSWSHTFGGSGEDRAFALLATSDGGAMSLGGTASQDGDFASSYKGDYDMFLVNIDSAGIMRRIDVYGGEKEEQGYAMTIAADGGIAMAGYSHSTSGDFAGLNKGAGDIILLKNRGSGPIVIPDSISVSPNPLTTQCTCTFIAHDTTPLVIELVSATGHIINRIVDTEITPGIHTWSYDTSLLAAGMYLFTATTTRSKLAAKLIIVR